MSHMFSRLASSITRLAGTPTALALALLSVVLWAGVGPVFHYSATWQLVINTGTTIISFVMVFLIQNSQNRDSAAIHAKLDVLIATKASAPNDLIAAEDKELAEIKALRKKIADLIPATEVPPAQDDDTQHNRQP